MGQIFKLMRSQNLPILKIFTKLLAIFSFQISNICHSQAAHIENSDQPSHSLDRSDLFPHGSADSAAAPSNLLLNTRNDQATFLPEDHDHESALADSWS